MFYTSEEVADMFKVGKETVLRWVRKGNMEAIKLGRDYRFSDESLQRFIQSKSTTSSVANGMAAMANPRAQPHAQHSVSMAGQLGLPAEQPAQTSA